MGVALPERDMVAGPGGDQGEGGTWCFAVGRGGKGSRLPPLLQGLATVANV
jgi:hypothetical protein